MFLCYPFALHMKTHDRAEFVHIFLFVKVPDHTLISIHQNLIYKRWSYFFGICVLSSHHKFLRRINCSQLTVYLPCIFCFHLFLIGFRTKEPFHFLGIKSSPLPCRLSMNPVALLAQNLAWRYSSMVWDWYYAPENDPCIPDKRLI